MTTPKQVINRAISPFKPSPEKKTSVSGLPKVIDPIQNGDDTYSSYYKLAHSYQTAKIDDQGCYIRFQVLETKVYVYTGKQFWDDFDLNLPKRREYTTIIYDHTYAKSEGCEPKRLDDPPGYEDDVVPDYPDDTPDIAMFIEINQLVSWVDYFGIFACDYAESIKIAFNDIRIISNKEIYITVNIEKNLKNTISLNPVEYDEGQQPIRNVPWLQNYLKDSDDQLPKKSIFNNQITYNGQQNTFKKYKGKRIGAYILEVDISNTPLTSNINAKAYIFIGHPLIVNQEMKKALKKLTGEINTPYWSGVSEKYFGFLRTLDMEYDKYYNVYVSDPHYQNNYRTGVNRYNAIIRSIPLLLYYELEPDKKIKTIQKPKKPDEPKECDCMSCDDQLARLILSKVNSLSQKIDQMSTPLNTLNSAIQTDGQGQEKNVFQQLRDLFFGGQKTPDGKPLDFKEILDRINKLQDYLGEKFYEADALLDKKMTDLDDFLGKPSFPMKLQPNLLSYYDDQPPIEINNFADLFAWYISQFDSLIGEFPIKIDIKDVDPSKEGDQSKSMEFANISEILAEIMGLLTMDTVNSDILINMCTRIAAETVGAKNAALIAQDYAKANADYLGYKGNIKKRDIQYSFDVSDLSRLDKLLENSEQRIMGWENQDKNSVADYLAKLMFAAQIIKGVYFKKSADGLVNTAKSFVDKTDKDDDSEWNKFLHDINNPDSQFNVNLDFPRARIKDRKDGEDDQS